MADVTRTFNVHGMTCDNCVHHVTTVVQGVAGVTDVSVSLAGNSAAVSGTFDDDDVIAAIEEEGYEAALRA